MRGKDIKDSLTKSGYKLKDIAESMGILPQTLQSLLQAEDIKTGVLEKIAKSINKSVYFFYEGDNAENNRKESDDDNIRLLINNNTRLTESMQTLIETNRKLSDRILELTDSNKRDIAGIA